MAASCAGCGTQTLDARGRFVEDGVSIEAHAEWGGEKIEIDNAGVTTAGGLSITSDAERNRVRSVARMLALADSVDKASADEAVLAARATYVITTSFLDPRLTSVRCAHGRTVNSAAADDTGCDALDISTPAGTLERPLSITARAGIGKIGAFLGDAVLGQLDLRSSRGPIEVIATATKGATISIVTDTADEIALRLPPDFAADVITLETSGAVDTLSFPDVQSGKGRGGAGSGAKSITVRSAGGRILLLARE